MSKWGTLFSEFKNSKGFWSTSYYNFNFIRLLMYILSQALLNSQLYLQAVLNIIFSLLIFFFLSIFKPFKEKIVLASAFIAEGTHVIANVLALSFLFDIKEKTQTMLVLEATFVVIIYANIGIQTIISLYQIYVGIKKIVRDHRNKVIESIEKDKQNTIPVDTKIYKPNFSKVYPLEN